MIRHAADRLREQGRRHEQHAHPRRDEQAVSQRETRGPGERRIKNHAEHERRAKRRKEPPFEQQMVPALEKQAINERQVWRVEIGKVSIGEQRLIADQIAGRDMLVLVVIQPSQHALRKDQRKNERDEERRRADPERNDSRATAFRSRGNGVRLQDTDSGT